MTDEETRAAERLALLQDADGFLRTIETKHDIEIGNRLRSILMGVNAMVDVAEGETEKLRYELARLGKLATPSDHLKEKLGLTKTRLEISDRANARLDIDIAALKHENEQLRDGGAPADDPVALFELLDKSVARLAARMRIAKIEEGGLYCGGCGASIADNAQGVQVLRDRIAELELVEPEPAEPFSINTSATGRSYGVATREPLTVVVGDDGASEDDGIEPVTCDYCDAPFVDGDCKCERTPYDEIPF